MPAGWSLTHLAGCYKSVGNPEIKSAPVAWNPNPGDLQRTLRALPMLLEPGRGLLIRHGRSHRVSSVEFDPGRRPATRFQERPVSLHFLKAKIGRARQKHGQPGFWIVARH